MLPARARFPDGFRFGTATYQTEGDAFGGAGRTFWADCAEMPGNVVRAETAARTGDHDHLWPQEPDQGANVRGFCCGSLLDDCEWSLVYEKRFGRLHVDGDRLKRVPKASYHALAGALAWNAWG